MHVRYVSLLGEMRRLYLQPRDMQRFRDYLKTMCDAEMEDLKFPPLVMVNPMAREHLLGIVEALLEMGADSIAEQAVAEACEAGQDVDAGFQASLVVLDDLKGGWTNRWASELGLRRVPSPHQLKERQARRFWITGTLWSSEPPVGETVRVAMKSAVYRTLYALRHGGARTLRELLAQEAHVAARAGWSPPTLTDEELQLAREVLDAYSESEDPPTLIECLFGDAAAATLGYAGQGLAPWAGLAVACRDATTSMGLRQSDRTTY